VGTGPRAVAAADLDGDGDIDLVTANSDSGDATVLWNDGSGVLAGATAIAAGGQPSDVAAADLDGDGDIDLVFANHDTPYVTVLSGDGAGAFSALPAIDTGSRPHVHGLAVADFDGDGRVDVAVDSADDDTVRVLFGRPGGLAPVEAFAAGHLPYYRIGAGDVVGDSLAEILAPAQRDLSIVILGATRGPARLAPVAAPVSLGSTPWMVRSADLDGQGPNDLAIILTDAVAVLRGTGGGRFEAVAGSPFSVPSATEVATGDLDGDGIADVAVGPWDQSDVHIFLGPSFAHLRQVTARRPVGLTIADLDGDGRGELIAASLLDDVVVVASLP